MSDEMIGVIVSVLMIVFIGIGLYFYKSAECTAKSVSFESHYFGLFSGCMVKHQGKFLPLDNIRGFDDRD